jgi:hypothetical protein
MGPPSLFRRRYHTVNERWNCHGRIESRTSTLRENVPIAFLHTEGSFCADGTGTPARRGERHIALAPTTS